MFELGGRGGEEGELRARGVEVSVGSWVWGAQGAEVKYPAEREEAWMHCGVGGCCWWVLLVRW